MKLSSKQQAEYAVFCNVYFAIVLDIEMCISEHHILMVRYVYLKDKLCFFSVSHSVDEVL